MLYHGLKSHLEVFDAGCLPAELCGSSVSRDLNWRLNLLTPARSEPQRSVLEMLECYHCS